MKLRIRGSSLRLRLTRGEVTQFMEQGCVAERIVFGAAEGASLRYVIERSDRASAMTARLEGGAIIVTVPAELGQRWAQTESVGLRAEQPLEGGDALRILVEKDFACLEPRPGEDDDDAYPNPDRSC